MSTAAGRRPNATSLSAGAKFGILIGCTAWAVALIVVCLAQGRTDVIASVLLPVLLGSLGVGMLVLTVLSVIQRLEPAPRAAVRVPATLGSIFVAMGSLLLLADGFVTPLLLSDAKLRSMVESSGGVIEIPTIQACLVLAVGCSALFVAMRQLARA